MYGFIVLGIIPGTNIALSFQAWLVIAAVLPVGLWLGRVQIRRFLLSATPDRSPLPASQLHHRLRPTAR